MNTEAAYRNYLRSLDVLAHIETNLVRAMESASKSYQQEIRKANDREAHCKQAYAEAERLVEETLSQGRKSLSAIGREGMLPRKRRPSPMDRVAAQDLSTVKVRVASLLTDLEGEVGAIRERRRRKEEEEQKRLEAERMAEIAREAAERQIELHRRERIRRIRNVVILIVLVSILALVIVL